MAPALPSVEQYAARVAAFDAMRARWRGQQPGDRWSGGVAEQARADPRRQFDANLEALASFLEPTDVVLDVGAGAGRVSLPLARRCRELIAVDPSAAMRAQFEAAASEAAITKVRYVESSWPAESPISADVVLTTHVTYFVRDIVPFVEALEAAARRRVIISLWSVPPPMQGSNVFELILGGPVEVPPGHRELLPVLWDLGILPEVRVLPLPMRQSYAWPPQPSREQMLERALQVAQWQGPVDLARARGLLEERFDELFVRRSAGYQPQWPSTVREMLITWEPRRPKSA